MKKVLLVFVIAFAFSTTAMAAEIAISTQAGWFGQPAADREMQEIVDNVAGVSIEVFPSDQHDALANWVTDHTGDGVSDLLIMCGQFPATIYAPGNAQADDSLAELFLDDGNTIVNTGDYMFYVVDGAGTNGEGGIRAMMDNPSITMWDDDTAVVVTADGQEYTPSLVDYATDRPFHLNELDGDWEPELILAQNAAGTRADPVIVVNTATGGRLGIFYQTSGQDDDPRGEVMSEWINNWWVPNVAVGNPLARRPDPEDGALFEQTWGSLSWSAGDWAVSHDLYVGTNFHDVNSGAADTFVGNLPTATQILGFVDDVRIYDKALTAEEIQQVMLGNTKLAGSPVPDRDAIVDIRDISSLSWSAGDTAVSHDVYFGTVRDAVASADNNTPEFQGNQAGTSLSLAGLAEFGGGDYYWRINEVEAGGTVNAGTIWKFTVPDHLIVDDIESYNDLPEDDPASNRIYLAWIDGFGTTTNGAVVGNLDVPLTERGNVHGGSQAMPYSYDNNLKTSEATLTLTPAKRDWTEQGVTKLSLWFRGDSANAAERMFVALNGNAVVYHDDASATQTTGWTEWVIDLAAFGVDLTNVNTITIGFGTKNSPAAGGTGIMYFDDIVLIR